jgi:DNA-binding HxlR family transcriptional regulator
MVSDERSLENAAISSESWVRARYLGYLIDGRWTLAILSKLVDRSRRYHDLHDAIDGISHKC